MDEQNRKIKELEARIATLEELIQSLSLTVDYLSDRLRRSLYDEC
jgi:hypothetical protein